MKKLAAFLILLCPLSANAGGAGTAAVSSLKLDGSARALAMGGAFVAVADDSSALFYNPAGLATLQQKEFMLTHTEWIDGVRTEYGAYAHPLSRRLTLGAGLNFLFTDEMTRYSSTGQNTGTFGASEGFFALAGAYKASERLSFGLAAKYVRQSVDDASASAMAGDAGVLYRAGDFGFGAALQNFGQKMKLVSESFSLPLTMRAGVSWRALRALLVSAEYFKTNDDESSPRLGAEYAVYGGRKGDERVFVRAGWRGGQSDGAGSGVSAGAGVELSGWSLNYAFMPYGDLGDAHKITLACRFGRQRAGVQSDKPDSSAYGEGAASAAQTQAISAKSSPSTVSGNNSGMILLEDRAR